jgi:RimJ/RimL family protein N-acetyltransferase
MSEPPVVELDASLVLDGWRPVDAAAHRTFGEDEAAARFCGWTVEEARAAPDAHYAAVVEQFRRDWDEGSRLSFAIRRRDTGLAVGAVELHPDGTTAEISYLVAPRSRGQGIAPRAVEAMLRWAAAERGIRTVVLRCHVENAASQKVADKAGFALTSREGDELCYQRQLPDPQLHAASRVASR